MTLQDLADLGHADFTRDRWGRPLIEPKGGGKPKPYTRSSSAAKTIEDTFNLELWQRRNIAYGMAQDSSLVARVLAVGGTPSEWDQAAKKQINDICEAAAAVAQAHKAADIGTALHAMVEQVNLGKEVQAGPYEADLAAYRRAIADMGWTINPEFVECRMVCDSLQMAGTCDMIVADANGNHYVADLKTSASVDYGGLGWAAQLATYAHSELYDPLLNARLQTPEINKEVGYIVHLPAGRGECTIHQVDLAKGFDAAFLANTIRTVRNESKKYLSPVQQSVAPEASKLHDPTDNLKERLRWLIDNGHADTVRNIWPESLPTLKQGGHDADQLAEVTRILEQAERLVGAPFNPPAVPTAKPRKRKAPAKKAAATVDEGPDMEQDQLLDLANRYGALESADRQRLVEIAAEANASGQTISVSARPSERRWWITEALIRWCHFGWDDDVISAAIHKITGESHVTIGASLARMSTHQAEQLAELATELTEERVTLAIGPDGITFTGNEEMP
ncbi:MAG TPA: hypothetical protein VIG24_01330 [Acidimicrobiia bacterium]